MSNHTFDPTKVSWLTITDANDGQRIDNFLLTLLKGAPKTLVYRIIRKGEVRINKGRVKADSRIQTGDVVRVPPVRLPEKAAVPEAPKAARQQLQLAIIYEDNGLLAINKPEGLAVHGGSGVSLGLIETLRQARPDHSYLELVHRLDRDTSGIILVAKKRSVLTALQRMLASQRGVTKHYLAMVHGHWPASVKNVYAPLKKVEREGKERIVLVSEEGKASHTRTQLLSVGAHYSLVRAEPVTGRTHQIRVHCQTQGAAIAGDLRYCDNVQQGIDQRHKIQRLMLHAYQLAFRHPESGENLLLSAPLSDEFRQTLQQQGCDAELDL